MKSLRNQVEKIIDEGQGDRRSVVVCMAEQHGRTVLPDLIANTLLRRRLILTARDVMPCPRDGRGGDPSKSESLFVSAANSSEPGGGGKSLTSTDEIVKELKQEGMRVIAPLFSLEVVQRSIVEAQKFLGQEFNQEAISLWPAHAVHLDISRDDLASLVDSTVGIASIHANDTVPLPQIVEVFRVPEELTHGAASSWGVQKINALAAWGVYGSRGGGVTVGILDSGLDVRHPDLAGKLADWAEFDENGVRVYSNPHDSGLHGTVCSGTIAGGKHSGQWIGVAPEAKLAAGLVLGNKPATVVQILAGMRWAIEKQVDVLNMSLGKFIAEPETPQAFAWAMFTCLRAGIVPVIAIGNDGAQTSDTPGNDLFAYATGSTDYRDQPAGFSGGRTQIIRESQILAPQFLPFIYQKPDVSAPGVAIKTSVPVEANPPWGFFDGTSLAATHVSGAIALLLGATKIRERVCGWNRAWLIHDFITSSVDELGESGLDARFGFGRIDVLRAIGFAYECGYAPEVVT